MPAISPLSPLNALVGRSALAVTNLTLSAAEAAGNTTAEPQPILVVCAFPVSGQYGHGSRILYYVLVAACLLARKREWLRNACLAAALIVPAIAAIHGIVLAALHREGKVDMDLYGALQLCSIGILTAPATARLSNTYFNNPGRNTIFVWTVLLLAGLLALTVEFFRSNAVECGEPIYDVADFIYGKTMCGPEDWCSIDYGPQSPMREGSADNIYVIPAPRVLTFGAATLIAAASCIPAILSMASMWDKIVKINWKERFGDLDAENEVIEGTNGATVGKIRQVESRLREFLSVVEVPVFGGAVLALIVVGEMNFWSHPVEYQTEPMANVGQWAPIVASILAACGSLYMLLAAPPEGVGEGTAPGYHVGHCPCPCHEHGSSPQDLRTDDEETAIMTQTQQPGTTRAASVCRHDTSPDHSLTLIRSGTHPDTEYAVQDEQGHGLGLQMVETDSTSAGKRPEVARILSNIAEKLGTASPDRYNDYEFKHGKATGFPEIPGEENRNRLLLQIKEQWGQSDLDGDDAPTPRGRSRANSFNGEVSRTPRTRSRAQSFNGSPSRSHSPQPPHTPTNTSFLGLPMTESPKTSSESVFLARRPSAESDNGKTRISAELDKGKAPMTAEAEKAKTQTMVELEKTRTQTTPELEKTKTRGTVVTLHSAEGSPAIVLSSEDEPEEHPGPDVASSSHVGQNPP